MSLCRTIEICQAYNKNLGLVFIYGDYDPSCIIQTFDETIQISSAKLIKEIFQKFNIPINEDMITQFEQYMNNFITLSAQNPNPEVSADDIMNINNFLLNLAQSLQQYLNMNSINIQPLQDTINLLQTLNVHSGDIVLGEHRNILSQAMLDILNAISSLIIELQANDSATGYDSTNPSTGQSSSSLEQTESYIVDSSRDFPIDAQTFYLGIAGEFAEDNIIEDTVSDFSVNATSFKLGIAGEVVSNNSISDSVAS